MGGKAGVQKIFTDVVPFLKAAIVEQFQVICDDEWYKAICQAFLEHNQAANSPVAVLEWVDGFKSLMKLKDILKGLVLFRVIFFKESFYIPMNIFWVAGCFPSNFVWKTFVFSDSKPHLTTV